MKMFWDNMNGREKMMVAGGVILVLIFFSYMLFVKPVSDEYARLNTEIPAKRADLKWMRAAAAESRNIVSASREAGSSSLLKRIDQTARQFKISTYLTRVEPVGNGGVKIWLDEVLYTDLMKWLRSLVTVNMFSVTSMNVEKSEAEGYVSVRLSLEQR